MFFSGVKYLISYLFMWARWLSDSVFDSIWTGHQFSSSRGFVSVTSRMLHVAYNILGDIAQYVDWGN